jgi:hypothetical protein
VRRIEYALLAVARFFPCAVALALALPTAAARADGPRFGDPGTFAFGGDIGIGGQQGIVGGYDTILSLELDPAVDLFPARRLSLGVGSVLSTTIDRTSPGSSYVSVSPRVGYAVPLGERLFLWPRLSADFASVWQAQSSGPTFHHRILSSTLYLAFDAFLLPHVALGIGPAVTQQLLHRTDSGTEPLITTVQLLVEIAGWL